MLLLSTTSLQAQTQVESHFHPFASSLPESDSILSSHTAQLHVSFTLCHPYMPPLQAQTGVTPVSSLAPGPTCTQISVSFAESDQGP